MNTLEQQLQDALHRHADSGGARTPLDLAGVKGRARRIVRRRRATAVGLAAAVAAVLVPATLAVAPAFDRGSEAPVAPRPTPAPAPTPEHALPGDTTLDFRDLPSGPAPSIGYLDLTGEIPVVVERDGNETLLELQHEPVHHTALADGRYVVLTRDDEGVGYVEVTDSGGTTRQAHRTVQGFAVDDTHTQVAWADPDGEVMVLAARVEEPRVLAQVDGATRLTVTDLAGRDCFATPEPGGQESGCVVRVGTSGVPGPGFLVTGQEVLPVEGTTEEFFRHSDSISLGDPQETSWTTWTAGIRRLGEGTACSEVYGKGPGAAETSVLVETCEHVFATFSPDATSLLAWGTENGGYHPTVAVYDLTTGSVRWQRSATTAEMGQVAYAEWEDEEHLVASVFQGGEWQLVRFDRDGAVERLTEPVAGDMLEPAYLPEVQQSTW
ncbi:hypothetical protein [Nocardioides campestrisoli]|uniref:hypothetical protein n=1 Tax=Nocardioides campestrisoli TaxID=2736757 RepID=UPI0015E6C239|nr:hypothetical protein [Nocardioides campestrisoli]